MSKRTMDLEQRIAKIQRSTRTTLPVFVPVHNALRMKFRWYYRWHLHPLASFVHLAILLIFSTAWVWSIYSEFTPGTVADNPPLSITITDKPDWQAQTFDEAIIDTETVPGSVKLLQGKDGYHSGWFGSCNGTGSNTINSWDSLYFQFPLQVANFPANVTSARLKLYVTHGYWAGGTPPDPRYVPYQISGIGSNWTENPMTCTPAGNGYSKSGVIDMLNYTECYGQMTGMMGEGGCYADFWPNTYIPFELDGGTPAEVAQKWAGWGIRAQITHLDGFQVDMRETGSTHPPQLEINFANGEVWNVNLPVQSGSQSGTIISTPTQIDGGADFTSWDTFTSSATIPANTSINYRFRTSDDAMNWGSWTASTPYSASIDLGTLLGETDKLKRYLQVETTLANTDGASTPILDSYTANMASPICPVGTTEQGGSRTLNSTADWDAGTNTNTATSNDVIKIDNKAGKLDLQSIYNSDASTVSTVMDWAVETGDKANPLDGNTSTLWGFTGPSPASTGNDDGNPFANGYWLMDLKQPYDLSRMRMYMNNDPDAITYYSFQFSVSSDGINYTVVAEASETEHQQWYGYDFSTQARYIKLHINAGGWMSVKNLAEIEIYGNALASHLSAPTQLDGTADLATWTTFTSSASVPANTYLNYRFRTSSDTSNWGSWTASTPYSASIDLTTLLSQEDVVKRYLQVETTLANSDGVSTPTLSSYTANYIDCIPDDPPPPTCSDGIQNGDETGVDCGGSCEACPVAETCDDSIQNQDETGVDCGGVCGACPVDPTCNDGLQNGDETGVDTGGSCPAVPSCSDGVQNQSEIGVDCGGECGACPIEPTCEDGIQNQNETGVDTGGVCGEQCKLNECASNASEELSVCQGAANSGRGSYESCLDSYCAAVRKCNNDCGTGDSKEENTTITTPNGGESYNIENSVPVRWYFTAADKRSRISIGNLPIKMSISLDGGASYRAVKTLIPATDPNSAQVTQYRGTEPPLEIGTYRTISNSNDMEYYWIPGDPAFISDQVRLKLETYTYNCLIKMNDDTSDNNFRLFKSENPKQIYLKITPTSIEVEPGDRASFEVKAYLADGTEVTSSTVFSYVVTDTARIESSEGNRVTLIANEKDGYFDHALQVTGIYQGYETRTYGALEIQDPTPPIRKGCTGWCNIKSKMVDLVERTIKGLESEPTVNSSLALIAAIIALANLVMNSLSLFRNVIAPLIKGKEKKKATSTVYDVVTGLPIEGARVMLISNELHTLSAISVSDKDGKYSFDVSPDREYEIKVEKDGFVQYHGGKKRITQDGLIYDNNYLGEVFQPKEDQYAFTQNIPLLEINPKLKAKEIWRKSRISQLLIALNISLLLLGSGLALIIFLTFPTTINYVIMCLYILILSYHLINRFVLSGRSYGTVVDVSRDREAVDLAIVRAVSIGDRKLARTVVSDIRGRYTLMLPKGKYVIFANKEGLQQLDHIEMNIKSSFAPRHEQIRMDKAPALEELKEGELHSKEGSAGHTPSVNSASELIERYKP